MEYIVRKENSKDIEVTNYSYDTVEIFSLDELIEAWSDGTLLVKHDDIPEQAQIANHDIKMYTQQETKDMEIRYRILEPIINGQVKPAQYTDYINGLPKDLRKVTSIASIYRWKKRWDSTQDKRSLIRRDDLKGPKQRTTPTEIIDIIKGILKQIEKEGVNISNRKIHLELKRRLKDMNLTRDEIRKINACSDTTVYRIVQDLTDTYQKDKLRHGVVQANLKREGSTGEVYVERPLQRVEIDWTPIDLFIVDVMNLVTERYYLVYGIDKLTGYPLGFYISEKEPDAHAIKQCLLHIMLPKTHIRKLYPNLKHDWLAYGVPETIVLDNAKVNESEDLEEICNLLGVELDYPPIASGHLKGTIERAFQSLNTKVFHGIPGTTFSNTKEKDQYDSEGKACVTLRAMYEIIHITMIELVANDYDTARGGTPHILWTEALKDTRVHRKLPYRKEDLKLLLATGIETRTITNKGINIQNQFYQSSELMKLRDRKERTKDDLKVRVRFDKADMRVIYIWDEKNRQYLEAYPTRNSFRRKRINPEYPVHYEQLHYYNYKNYRGYKEFDTDAVGEGYNEVRDIVNLSRLEILKLEKMTQDERAAKYYDDISAINLVYDLQIAPEGIETLELLDENDEEVSIALKNNIKSKKKKQAIPPKVTTSKEKEENSKLNPNTSSHLNPSSENIDDLSQESGAWGTSLKKARYY
ncbi:transposase [Paenibacillus tritici]|uniref:Mu transposase C-terminal domain-containing protein n=1 Tax=Paenibacillus tritici TaxID=1873425 RepID=UPI001BAA8E29|nr:Mu transposase C-terminal domain-containing protein [Paenibacillus tritici]QUL57047.1 transposase [Paenibacillus tritici]